MEIAIAASSNSLIRVHHHHQSAAASCALIILLTRQSASWLHRTKAQHMQTATTSSERRDFIEERCSLQMLIEDELGAIAAFLPKYHCPLNAIEYIWGNWKQRIYKVIDGSYATLRRHTREQLLATKKTRRRRDQKLPQKLKISICKKTSDSSMGMVLKGSDEKSERPIPHGCRAKWFTNFGNCRGNEP